MTLQLWELLDLRGEANLDTQQRAEQAVADLHKRLQALVEDLREAEGHLELLSKETGELGSVEMALLLLARSEQIRQVSKLRSTWCKTRTALEEGLFQVQRIRLLRQLVREELERAS